MIRRLLLAVIVAACLVARPAAPESPPPNACTAATDCKGMLPHLCQQCSDGKTHCAHWACARGQCATEVCPAAPASAPAPQCTQASECKGMLPHMCRVCPDGKERCAHWACTEGRCQTVTCD
jgi:hypothetical protein